MDSLINDLRKYSKLNDENSFTVINGVNIPTDAAAFFEKYNDGINEYIWFISPYDDNWDEMIEEQRETYESVKDSFEQDALSSGYVPNENEGYPFAFYPDESGLIPWAYCDNGTVFYWKPENNKMNIIVYGDGFQYFKFDLSTTDFIYKLVTKSLSEMSDFLPDDLFDDEVICE
jgi:hypothetical protein